MFIVFPGSRLRNRHLGTEVRGSSRCSGDVIRFHLDVEVGTVQLVVGSSDAILTAVQVSNWGNRFGQTRSAHFLCSLNTAIQQEK